MLSLVFSVPDKELDEDGEHFDRDDYHEKDINVLHLACQEGLCQTVEFILQTEPN